MIPEVFYVLCDWALQQIRTNPCESPRIRTNPYQKRARIRRESVSLIICHPFLLTQYVAQISPIVVHCFTIQLISIMDCARLCPRCGLDSEHTQKGRLPPWEVAKAFAFHTVIAAVCGHLGQTPPELLGKSNDAYRGECRFCRPGVAPGT